MTDAHVPTARDDPRLALRARQIFVHGLSQHEHGTAGLADAIDATFADVDPGRPDGKRRFTDERRRQALLEQLAEFPCELARCTCNTPSWNRSDHANSCRLGPTPSLSSNPTMPAATRRLSEEMF